MLFPSRIAAIRKELKLSQEKFGELVNVSQRSVAFWESGERMPSHAVIVDLAEKLGVSADYLLGLSDEKAIKKEPTVEDDELRASTLERIKALPEPVLLKLLDLMDAVRAFPADPAASAAPSASSAPADPANGSAPADPAGGSVPPVDDDPSS